MREKVIIQGKNTVIIGNKRQVSPNKRKALEKLMPAPTLGLYTLGTQNVAEYNLRQRIEKLWMEINLYNWGEISRIKNQVRENKLRANQLMRDNLFELDVNAHDQRQLLKVKRVNKKVKKILQQSKD